MLFSRCARQRSDEENRPIDILPVNQLREGVPPVAPNDLQGVVVAEPVLPPVQGSVVSHTPLGYRP